MSINRIICVFLFTLMGLAPIMAIAVGLHTTVGTANLYSEYYPNTTATFKGTVVFINGGGTPLTEW